MASRLRAHLLLFVALWAPVKLEKTVYFMVGRSLVLRPDPPRPGTRITSVSWKHNEDLVVEWDQSGVELTYFGILKGRASMDKSTGVLNISSTVPEVKGVYKVEINDQLQRDGYHVTALEAVPLPEVVLRPVACSPSLPTCTLSCTGSTEGAGPVTFLWKAGEEEWQEGDRDLLISKEGQRPKTFSCRMRNPVSQQDSETVQNPFYQEDGPETPVHVAAYVVPIVLLLGGGVAVALYLLRDKEPVSGWLARVRSPRGERPAARGNGVAAPPEAAPQDESVRMMKDP